MIENLFHQFLNLPYQWNPEEGSSKLQIRGNMVQLSESDPEYHSILMTPCITNRKRHQFQFIFNGRLEGNRMVKRTCFGRE